jgi:hypothetical protein
MLWLNTEVDMAVLQEAVGELEAYLVAGELYPSPAGTDTRRLSAGQISAGGSAHVLERLVAGWIERFRQAALERVARSDPLDFLQPAHTLPGLFATANQGPSGQFELVSGGCPAGSQTGAGGVSL